MRPATDSVGLVSPRSTWDSMGADTPLRSARSRRDRAMPSRRARMRGPTSSCSATAVAMYGCTLSRTSVCCSDVAQDPCLLRGELLVADQLPVLQLHELLEAVECRLLVLRRRRRRLVRLARRLPYRRAPVDHEVVVVLAVDVRGL